MMRIEADQRLIQQQQSRAAEQGLRQQQALSLAAGGFRERAASELGRIDHLERPCTSRRASGPKQRQTPAMAVGAAGDEVPAAEPQLSSAPRVCGM